MSARTTQLVPESRAAPTKEGTLCPDGSWSKHGSRRCCLPMGHTGPHEYVGVAAPTKEDTDE